jgi:hypothetical protein
VKPRPLPGLLLIALVTFALAGLALLAARAAATPANLTVTFPAAGEAHATWQIQGAEDTTWLAVNTAVAAVPLLPPYEARIGVVPGVSYTFKACAWDGQATSCTEQTREAPQSAGRPAYQGDAATWADPLMTAGDASWLAGHWTAFSRYYPPYGNGYPVIVPGVKWTPYRDAWTHNSEGGEAGTNRFHLETLAGRTAFMVGVTEDFARGGIGEWLDDWQYAGGHHPSGAEGTAWNAGETALAEAIRAAHPAAHITVNTHWFEVLPGEIKGSRMLASMILKHEGANDPVYDRNLKSINAVFEEWGAGKTSGLRFGSSSSYREWLEYVEWLHVVYGVGITVGWDYHDTSAEAREWDLATLLLVSNGSDSIDGGHQYPTAWPHRYEMSLGDPLGARARSSFGLWSRQFTHGVAYTVENGGQEAHITLPEPMENAAGGHVTSVTLKANQGAVLTR